MNETSHSNHQAMQKDRVQATKAEIMQKTLNWFVVSLLVATIGVAFGNQLNPAWYLPLVILEFVFLFAAIFARRSEAGKRFGTPLLLGFAFVTGVMTGPTIAYYLNAGAATAVLLAFSTATVTFIVLGFVGAKIKTDLHFMGKALLASLLILIVISLFTLFVPISGAYTLIAGAGTLIFSLYILFDFNQMMKRDITMDDVPMLALSLYLDFLNLFLYLLQLLTGRD
ncbi:Bax inhibitor-1 family protein [Listeria costaricensis]|uniref:Bax inhibitor-1 family protein n=1 Tax=Listeria costaricensis TaxID=2026604 RepID=UPI000C0880D2|nr:Bax inhibitor-1 family protein [Listeria costaricensis]